MWPVPSFNETELWPGRLATLHQIRNASNILLENIMRRGSLGVQITQRSHSDSNVILILIILLTANG
jgi:hypothetical protein